jgi:hypothetical protein
MTHIARDLAQFNLNTFIDRASSAVDRAATGVDKAVTAVDTARAAARDPLALVNRVGLYTAYTPPREFTGPQIKAMVDAPPAPRRPGQKSLLERLKPALVIDTALGRRVLAPYGMPAPDEWKKNTFKLIGLFLGGLALYTAGGYYLGYKAGQRRAGRLTT